MPYQTSIPDDFVAPQYRDDTFEKALHTYKDAGNRAAGPWICALPRPDLDPSSRVRYDLAAGINYDIKAKTDQVAVMHVLSVGKGRVRLGHREVIPVAEGDLVLVNLREAGHWVYVEGVCCYFFTGDVAMARMYRTHKSEHPPLFMENEHVESYRERRARWEDELFWNIRDVLNDYVILGRDPEAERLMRNGAGTLVEIPGTAMTDGTRSDDARDNRFPVVYRRVLGAGPGRAFRRESDLGMPEWAHSVPEVEPGDMLCFSKNVRAANLEFQGMRLDVIHAASVINAKQPHRAPAPNLSIQESCAAELPWDHESETDAEEDARLRGLKG